MEIFIWILIGTYGLFAIHFGIKYTEDEKLFKGLILLLSGIICIACAMTFTGISISIQIPPKVHSEKFNLKTEIRQEILNGKEISRDTIYIFTPKKK